MTDIIIPGYESLKANQLYRKNSNPNQGSEQILHLSVYRSPTESAIVGRIRAAAQSMCRSDSEKSSLTGILSSLPGRDIDALADGAKSAVSHIRRHFLFENRDSGLREGEFYLNARYISGKKVDMDNFVDAEVKEVVCAELLVVSQDWNATVTLSDGRFPVAVRELIRYEVTRSALLKVNDHPDYSIVVAELNLLCDVFGTNPVSGLADLSDVAIAELSDRVASKFVECSNELQNGSSVPKQETNAPPRPPFGCSNN